MDGGVTLDAYLQDDLDVITFSAELKCMIQQIGANSATPKITMNSQSPYFSDFITDALHSNHSDNLLG